MDYVVVPEVGYCGVEFWLKGESDSIVSTSQVHLLFHLVPKDDAEWSSSTEASAMYLFIPGLQHCEPSLSQILVTFPISDICIAAKNALKHNTVYHRSPSVTLVFHDIEIFGEH